MSEDFNVESTNLEVPQLVLWYTCRSKGTLPDSEIACSSALPSRPV